MLLIILDIVFFWIYILNIYDFLSKLIGYFDFNFGQFKPCINGKKKKTSKSKLYLLLTSHSPLTFDLRNKILSIYFNHIG